MIFGTRPEAVKMVIPYRELKSRGVDVRAIATAQHRQMLDQVLELFEVQPFVDLNVMKPRQTLSELTANLCKGLDEVLSREHFDWLLVQGDTTSTFVGSLVGFYHKIPVGHVEAGLRSFDPIDPFPEELNRRLTTVVARAHFAPTPRARQNLLEENVDPATIHVTGNTVIDALQWVIRNRQDELGKRLSRFDFHDKPYVLVTMHRRENWGQPMRQAMQAIQQFLEQNPTLHVVFPVHLNPTVREIVFPVLQSHPRAHLLDPAEYIDFVALMQNCLFLLTDSGGLQEEGPALGKPVLVLRKTTERPEALEAGTAILVGTDPDTIVHNANRLVQEPYFYDSMARAVNPFGDGTASEKIAGILLE